MPRSPLGLLLGGLCALAVGCSVGPGAGSVEAPVAAPARIYHRWPGCAALGAFAQPNDGNHRSGVGSVPVGFSATAAIYCQTETRVLPDQTEVELDLERRAISIEPLLSYLARPSQRARHPRRLVCAAMGWTPPWLFLTDDAGRWIAPRLPTDPCGFPLGMFDEAHQPGYLDLHYRDLVVHRRKLK